MRILRTILTLDPRYGGPVEGLKRSIEQHTRSGHFTEVVCLDRPDSSFLADLPFPAHALGPTWGRYGYTSRLSSWIAANGHRFDAAVVHGLWNHSSVGGWYGLRRARLPYLVFAHGMLDPWFRDAYPLKHLAKQAFWLLAQGKVLRDADGVLFTSEEEMRLAEGVFWGPSYRAQVVAYGAADAPDQPIAQDKAFRQAAKALGARRYLLYLGRIHPKKGCDLLV
ncbi:MAG TPA: glycosyltransferase, partial [Anaerolineales bacterium]